MILAAAALLLPAVSDAVTFAPVLDRPYQLSVREERSDPTGTHHYGADRTVIFRREADGLVAEVTLLRVTQDVGGETGRRFERSAGALTGRTLRFHLGPDGAVRSIDDQAAVWQAMLAGIAAMGERTPAGVTGIGRSPAAPLAALSPERVQSVIGSILRPAIASTLPAPGMHPVTVPSRALAAGGQLTGSQTITPHTDGTLQTALHASGPNVTLERSSIVDTAHGLVLQAEEVQTTTIGTRAQITRTHTELSAPVS